MKARLTLAVISGIVIGLFIASFVYAEDEATLKLQIELQSERIARIEAQSIIMQQQYVAAKAALEKAVKAVNDIEAAKKK